MRAFILAGGQSSRMGRDKAQLPLEGRPLIEHMVERLRELGMHPRICGARADLAQFAEVVPDRFQDDGPLAGIEAALTVSDAELNLFVPVDLPGLPAVFLKWMMARAEMSLAVATIPRYGDRLQPLCAVYSRRLVEGIREALAAGRRKVMDGIFGSAAGLREAVDVFDVECVAAADPAEWAARPVSAEWFRNVNTPGEYAALRAGAGGKGRHPIS